MKTLFRCFFPCLLTLIIANCAYGAVGSKVSFSNIDSQQHLSGPKCSSDDLKGKVILFEYWGINCPPCLAAMPHLQELYSKYSTRGFVVIGSHSQLPSPRVQEYLKTNKITFPIYQSVNLPEAPCPGGLPHAVLIGGDGKVVAEGYPSTLYDKVPDEVAKLEKGYPILGDMELKKYKSLSKSLNTKGSNLESKIAPLREKADDEEAQAICKAFDEWQEQEKARVQNLCQTNPLKAVKAIQTFKTLVPSVTDFDEKLASFKKNAGLQKLADTQKKIQALKKNKEKGRKISAASLKKLKETLENAQESSDEDVQHAASALMPEIEGLVVQEKN